MPGLPKWGIGFENRPNISDRAGENWLQLFVINEKCGGSHLNNGGEMIQGNVNFATNFAKRNASAQKDQAEKGWTEVHLAEPRKRAGCLRF